MSTPTFWHDREGRDRAWSEIARLCRLNAMAAANHGWQRDAMALETLATVLLAMSQMSPEAVTKERLLALAKEMEL